MKKTDTTGAAMPGRGVLVWMARLCGFLVVGAMLLFAVGEGFHPGQLDGLMEWLQFLCFPLLAGLGIVWAWSREVTGGCMSLAGMAGFYLLNMLSSGHPPSGFVFPLMAVPGVLFLLAGLAARDRR